MSKNTEIEAKFQLEVSQLDAIKSFLTSLSFQLINTLDQKDTYFIHKIRDGLSPHPKTYLRVRTNDGVSSTAMHYKNGDYNWTEIETKVADGDQVRLIYNNLGYDVDVEVHKLREVYTSLNEEAVEIVIDKLVGVGYFLEIEAPSLDKLWEVANTLNLKKEQADKIKDKSYADLVKEAKK